MDEDYKGSFNLTKKMAVNIEKTTDYGYYEKNYEGLYYDVWICSMTILGCLAPVMPAGTT